MITFVYEQDSRDLQFVLKKIYSFLLGSITRSYVSEAYVTQTPSYTFWLQCFVSMNWCFD